ncbi:MAG: kelch repeat-containing protein [Terriglobales bacterium]|jgi:N-acetylneuraminic acid mutarotase
MKTTLRLMLISLLLIGTASLVGAQSPAVTHNTWTSGAALPTAVALPAAAVVKNGIYVVGGDNGSGPVADVQIYDPATNSWGTGVPYPTAIEGSSAAVVKNVLYVFGGYNGAPSNAVWAYSTKTKTWTAVADMPTARYETAAVVEKNIIYVIGGVAGPGDFIATVESYNPATNIWTEEAPMLGNKASPAAGLLGTTIVATDGAVQGGEITGDTEGYDTATNTWTELTADPTARVFSCYGAIGSRFYDAGGYLNNAGAATTVNESFQLSKNKWTTTLAPMPQGTMVGSSAVYKKQLYCIGGWASWEGAPINNVQIYQP